MRHEPAFLEMFLTRLAFVLGGRSVYKAFADRLPLAGGEQALDFGCGLGTVAYYAAERLPQGHLTCLDISERWLKACRKTLGKYNNVSFRHSAPGHPLLAEESFNLVYCHFVLHDIPQGELEEVLPALARSLKSNGALVFREPLNELAKLSLIKSLAEQNGLALQDSRVTDVPLLGNALESVYIKG